jgi:predicted AlkP superfamily pyrophosphatase or phosphodiesterase
LTLTLAAALLAVAPAAGGAPLPPLSPRPRLVLAVAVDQMRFDYLTRFKPLFTGGLRALWDKGAVFTGARYSYAFTETGPGHSVLLSGRNPSHSGIVANAWWDPLSRSWTNVVDDPVQAAVGGTGRGASPVNLIGFTVGDVLKKASPESRVVGVSQKDRAAVLLAGRRADAAYWYESGHGGYVSSTYYMKTAPAWLARWNASRFVDRYAGRSWARLLPDEGLYLKYAGPDALPGEWDLVDTTFPHAIRGAAGSAALYDDIRRTPFADEMTLEVALLAMDAHGLGRDDATDLLAVSFSATDVIGHTYGAGSQEVMDQILRLDRTLGRLLAEVDRRVGPGRTLVVLSADHGSMPLVETLRAAGIDARRFDPAAMQKGIEDALALAFPATAGLVAAWDLPNLYLDGERIRAAGLKRAAVEAVIERALRATGVVQAVYTREQMLDEPPAGDPDFTLFRNSFFQPRSPDVMTLLKENVYLDARPGGTGHGTAHEYDRHVPVAFMGPGIRGGVYDAPCSPEDIAVTLGALLGLDYPMEDADRVLTEVAPVAVGAQ